MRLNSPHPSFSATDHEKRALVHHRGRDAGNIGCRSRTNKATLLCLPSPAAPPRKNSASLSARLLVFPPLRQWRRFRLVALRGEPQTSYVAGAMNGVALTSLAPHFFIYRCMHACVCVVCGSVRVAGMCSEEFVGKPEETRDDGRRTFASEASRTFVQVFQLLFAAVSSKAAHSFREVNGAFKHQSFVRDSPPSVRGGREGGRRRFSRFL